MGDESRAYMLQPGEGLPAGDVPATFWWKAGSADTGGAFTFYVADGNRVGPLGPLHIHHQDDECILLLEGETEVICGSRRFHLTPSCLVYLPHGVPHAFRNIAPVRNVTVMVPGLAWEHQRAHMIGLYQQGLSLDEVFATLPSEAHIEVVGPADWGDDVSGIERR
jgi:mannose-6-phosphate isomerase-like protein (cupin superfamily)